MNKIKKSNPYLPTVNRMMELGTKTLTREETLHLLVDFVVQEELPKIWDAIKNNNMNIIEMNNDDRFDIDLSSINAKIKTENPWDDRELPSIEAVNKFISTTHEFKNQNATKDTSNYFVEYQMEVGGKFHDSGIVTSQAELQTYTVGPIVHSYPTEFIKWIYTNRKRLSIPESHKNDIDYIAYGILVPIYRIFDLYNDYFKENRLKKLFMK